MAKLDDLQMAYKEQLRWLEQRAKNQEESDFSAECDVRVFINRQELRSHISNYRRAISQIQKTGG